MATLDALDPSVVYALFKGIPGTRKSTQALTFPMPQYWASADKKMNALIKPARAWGIDMKQIEYDDLQDYAVLQKKLESLQVTCKYKTLIFDSITSIGDVTNRQTIKAKAGTTNTQGQEKGIRVGGISVNSLEDYKAEAAAFQEIISVTKDIAQYHGCNIVLIGHVLGEKKEVGSQGEEWHRIIVTGGKIISAKIPAYCSEIYHFEHEGGLVAGEGGKLIINTEDTGYDFARTSLDLPRKIQIGNERLYGRYIAPAIARMKNPNPTGL